MEVEDYFQILRETDFMIRWWLRYSPWNLLFGWYDPWEAPPRILQLLQVLCVLRINSRVQVTDSLLLAWYVNLPTESHMSPNACYTVGFSIVFTSRLDGAWSKLLFHLLGFFSALGIGNDVAILFSDREFKSIAYLFFPFGKNPIEEKSDGASGLLPFCSCDTHLPSVRKISSIKSGGEAPPSWPSM